MERFIINKMFEWKNSVDRKPLILKGSRQVGKTWLMREFGTRYYSNYVYFNFDEFPDIKSIFENNKNPSRIISLLSAISGKSIQPENTLVIFDEIQECPDALNSLKYFCESANEYHIVAAGSLLGTLLSQPKSYPVGKVTLLDVSPLTFDEFLNSVDAPLYNYYCSIKSGQPIEEYFHKALLEHFHYYLIVGGMPECVLTWIKLKSLTNVQKIQKDLIALYENDFSKHNGKINSGRILLVFRSIVSQLAKDNSKFIYGALREGARAREFEEAIEWLVSSGLVKKVYCVSKPEHPLPAFDKLDSFKLFFFDTGLLKCMAGVDNSSIILRSDFQFKGALTENYVLQQLNSQLEISPRYYSNRYGEIDFVLQNGSEVIPVEVKSGTSKSATSFKSFIESKKPKTAIRFSEMNYLINGAITNIPLYLAPITFSLI